MLEPLSTETFINRAESSSSLVRFEDQTDKNASRLNYSTPLPGSYEGRFYLEVELDINLPWSSEATTGESRTTKLINETSGKNIDELANKLRESVIIDRYGSILPKPEPPINHYTLPTPLLSIIPEQSSLSPVIPNQFIPLSSSLPLTLIRYSDDRYYVQVGNNIVSVDEIYAKAGIGQAFVIYPTFGGNINYTFVEESKSDKDANPRFVIIEHYRLSSHFGDYGAGRTIKTFSLWPGEETKLYMRSWRRTEERFRQASTIFDSYTQEAADEFEQSLESENTYRSSYQKSKSWKAEGSLGLNLGIAKIGGGGGGGGSSQSARESFAKTVSKVSSHHASKASAKRENTVSTDLEKMEATEFEEITERVVKNVNLSRVLNLVCRELNQEFITYLSLINVTIAFVNDKHIYEEVPIYDIDRLINKYINLVWDGNTPQSININPRQYIRDYLVKQISTVIDYQGNKHELLEEKESEFGEKYLRIKRSVDNKSINPFYPNNDIPVEGIVLEKTSHTIRTDGIIIDALLGHGIALDNYALGTQQEVLLEKQLNNKKLALALKLIEEEDIQKIELFRSIFNNNIENVINAFIERIVP